MSGLLLDALGPNRTTAARRDARARGGLPPRFTAHQEHVTLDVTHMFDAPGHGGIGMTDLEALIPRVIHIHRTLLENRGDILDKGIPMTGWQDLPVRLTRAYLDRTLEAAQAIADRVDAFVSLGIGGSYLGLQASVQALTHTHFNALSREERGGAPEIHFLGYNMDPDHLRDTLDMLRGKRVALNVISKSGTTTETALTFRILLHLMGASWDEETLRGLVLVTTDREKGALKRFAALKGYQTFVVPEDIGGRFSVLSDVGMVGLAVAGCDIASFVEGFRFMRERTLVEDFWKNPSLVHAALRYLAWLKGKRVEVVATNAVSLYGVARWMEQLFPESEGHQGHGLWVSPSLYSEKLHANGQMVQDGARNLMETFLYLKEHDNTLPIPPCEDNPDGFAFLADKGVSLNHVNRSVVEGPAIAHYDGGVPNMTVEVPRRDAFCLGQVYFLMERSVAVSGLLLGHNPFVQPGVEAYKRAMFGLLGKPGYEEAGASLTDRIASLRRIRI